MEKKTDYEIGPGGESIFEQGDDLVYDPGFKFEITEAIPNAIDLAKKTGKKVILKFNDIDLEVDKDSEVKKVESKYFKDLDKLQN